MTKLTEHDVAMIGRGIKAGDDLDGTYPIRGEKPFTKQDIITQREKDPNYVTDIWHTIWDTLWDIECGTCGRIDHGLWGYRSDVEYYGKLHTEKTGHTDIYMVKRIKTETPTVN